MTSTGVCFFVSFKVLHV